MADRNDEKSFGRSLLCLYYTQQILPALAAVLEYRRRKGVNPEAPAVLLIWIRPEIEDAAVERRLEAFRKLLHLLPWVELCFPGREAIRRYLSTDESVRRKGAYLRNMFGEDTFSQVFYPHDISADFMAQSAMQAYPRAERVCFGDAMGVVYRNDYFESMIYPLSWRLDSLRRLGLFARHFAARTKRTWLRPPKKQRLEAAAAVLILPCDPGGDFLPGKELIVVSDACVRQILEIIVVSACRDGFVAETALHSTDTGAYLMLLGNYSDSRLCSKQAELALYTEVANTHVPAGSKIILKPHPSAKRDLANELVRAFTEKYNMVLTSADADEIPIEALPGLFQGRTVLSFSYSSVSLTYLYSARVMHVMCDELIRAHFFPEMQEWMRVSNDMYLKQLAVASNLRARAGGPVWQR